MEHTPRWTRIVAIMLTIVLFVMTNVRAGSAQDASPTAGGDDAIGGAVAWLTDQQQDDGSFLGFSGDPDTGTTIDAILALSAAATVGVDVTAPMEAALGYLAQEDYALVYAQTGVGQAAKLAIGLSAAGINPPTIVGVDPMTIITNGQDSESGIYGMGAFDHALGIIALAAAGEDVPANAFTALADTQSESGGWAFDGSLEEGAADGNTTSIVVQAIVAAGQGESELIAPAMSYLEGTVTEGGAAFNDAASSEPDSNSTAYVIQAIVATDGDPAALTTALGAYQNDSGGFFYMPSDTTDNLLSTIQAIPALAGVAFPFENAPAGGRPNASPSASPQGLDVPVRTRLAA